MQRLATKEQSPTKSCVMHKGDTRRIITGTLAESELARGTNSEGRRHPPSCSRCFWASGSNPSGSSKRFGYLKRSACCASRPQGKNKNPCTFEVRRRTSSSPEVKATPPLPPLPELPPLPPLPLPPLPPPLPPALPFLLCLSLTPEGPLRPLPPPPLATAPLPTCFSAVTTDAALNVAAAGGGGGGGGDNGEDVDNFPTTPPPPTIPVLVEVDFTTLSDVLLTCFFLMASMRSITCPAAARTVASLSASPTQKRPSPSSLPLGAAATEVSSAGTEDTMAAAL
mmetsp:Transcript_23085/g.45855  ORF Transcript_23085/g.45855 Transcript_23085/m.45855 type:complete len:282 (-) Transcript_23085:208-1053(-)